MKRIHVVIGVITQNDQLLISQRLPHQVKGGLWEFPGGKVEANEQPWQALKRELREELDIDVLEATPWFQFEYHYPHGRVLLDIWRVQRFSGTAIGKEGQPIRWILPEALSQFEFPAGNKLIIDKLLEKNAD